MQISCSYKIRSPSTCLWWFAYDVSPQNNNMCVCLLLLTEDVGRAADIMQAEWEGPRSPSGQCSATIHPLRGCIAARAGNVMET